jgi:two-component system, sensor histidine kinase PdtaS
LVLDGARVGAILFVHDATDVRRRERALISKDATIREIHHRVKNNLQTVAAMLRLQARRAESAEAKEVLLEAELRVAAIAVVHEALSSQPGEQVAFDEIVDRVLGLVRDAAPMYSEDRVPPVLVREGSWGDLAAGYATPLAMAVSELVHNAAEHAHAARVVVRLDAATGQTDRLVVSVSDDGRGLPAGFDPADAGLGLGIVQSLVTADLNGTCEFQSSSAGTTVVLTVPKAARE